MKIILARHGEALRGEALEDFGLSDKGKHQAQMLAESLTMPIDRIVTSSLRRAVETGQIIANQLEQHDPIVIAELCEISEGMNSQKEDLPGFLDRVGNCMNGLAEYKGTTLAVTHSGFIMASIRALFEIPTPGTGARLEPKHVSMTEWIRRSDHWELSYFNLETHTSTLTHLD